MKIKRFFAENIRQAMQMVRDELGADAVIMSNRAVEGGVEIVAARDFDEQVVHASAPAKGEVEISADYFKPTKNARNIKKVDLPDFQAEKNRLHVISSSRKPDEKIYKNASAKRGINQYVDNAQKGQSRGRFEHEEIDAVKSYPVKTLVSAPAEHVPAARSYASPSVMIKVPPKKAKATEVAREPLIRHQPIMPQARQTKSEVHSEARDLRQYFSEEYRDEFEEFLQDELLQGELNAAYETDDVQEAMSLPVSSMASTTHSELVLDMQNHAGLQNDVKDTMAEQLLSKVTEEIKSLRTSVDSKLSRINFAARQVNNPSTSPIRSELLHKLAMMSVSRRLSVKIANRFANHTNFDFVFTQAQELLAKVLPITEDSLLESGGVIALVGPTGVGKTTSVAKIAAQFTLKHGANQVALITTDNYRIAAHEQLNTYGRILNIPVRVASSAAELRQLLHSFSDKKLVLIDTAGMSQRDMKLIEQINALKENDLAIKSYLVMSAATEYKAMNEIIDAFEIFKPQAAILTKLDEAATIGSALSSLIEHNLALSFITNGQQVPEDMRHPCARELVAQCVSESNVDDDDYSEENNEAWVAQGYA